MAKFKYEVGKSKDEEIPKPEVMEDKSAIEKVELVLEEAISNTASDIHFEPLEKELRVRMRINGQLETTTSLPKELHTKVINRIKILSAMDITRNRIAQRGYFKLNIDEKAIEVYTNIYPCITGEKAFLKLHYRKAISMQLEHLGFFVEMLNLYKEALTKTHGLIIVAGPPANGRTSTLYACLNFLNSPKKNMCSFEHYIKYEIPGLIQGKPDELANFTFGDGVKAMLTQEPDVALVGELQEAEAVKHSIQAAFGNRIILGRMATNDTTSTISAMIDMGIPPFLITAALNAVLAQRLVRRICEGCKEPYKPHKQVVEDLGFKMRPDLVFYRGKGCAKCGGTGFYGKIGIFELFIPKEDVNNLIIQRAPASEIREAAIKSGMIPLKRDGIQKIGMGYTSLEEILNII